MQFNKLNNFDIISIVTVGATNEKLMNVCMINVTFNWRNLTDLNINEIRFSITTDRMSDLLFNSTKYMLPNMSKMLRQD